VPDVLEKLTHRVAGRRDAMESPMSRTRVHRPFRTWFDDPQWCVELHDHRTGPCDLPPLAEWREWINRVGGTPPWRCVWELRLGSMPRLCGCRLCTLHDLNREDRRRGRHQARAWLRAEGWVDGPPHPR